MGKGTLFYTSPRVQGTQQSYYLVEEDRCLAVVVEFDNDGERPWNGSVEYGLSTFFGEDGAPQSALLALDVPPEQRDQLLNAYNSLTAMGRRCQRQEQHPPAKPRFQPD